MYPASVAWPQRYGSDWTLPNADHARRVWPWSMWRSVVVPSAALLSLSYGVMFSAHPVGIDRRRQDGQRDLDLEA